MINKTGREKHKKKHKAYEELRGRYKIVRSIFAKAEREREMRFLFFFHIKEKH